MLAKLKTSACILGFSMLSLTAFADPTSSNTFAPTIQVQDLPWVLKTNSGSSDSQIATYAPANNNATGTDGKIVIQRIKLNVGKGVIPAAVVESEIAQLNKNGRKTAVNMLETHPMEAVADLHLEIAPGKMREDLQRIVFNPDHNITVIMHYGMTGEINNVTRNDMIKVLKNISPPF